MPTLDTIPILPFGMLNAFLLTEGSSAILIDTGLPGAARRIARALARRGLGWSALRLVILTHGHIDHAGSATALREFSDAPILAHPADLPLLTGTPPTLRPTGAFGHLFRRTGLIERPFDPVTPDIQPDTAHDLSPHGIAATVLHTPGHTQGSLSVLLPDGRCLAGDLLSSGILLGGLARRERPKPPPFEEDPAAVTRALHDLMARGAQTFFLGHGGPLPAAAVRRWLATRPATEIPV